MQNYVDGLFCFNYQSIFYTTKSSFYYDVPCHDLFDLEITVISDNYIIYASTLQFIAFTMTDAEEYKLLFAHTCPENALLSLGSPFVVFSHIHYFLVFNYVQGRAWRIMEELPLKI